MDQDCSKKQGTGIAALVSDLADKNSQIRMAARASIVALGCEAVPYLLPLASDKKHEIRWEAVKTMADIKHPSAADGLIRALVDTEFDVRWLGAEGLAALGRHAVPPVLQALQTMDESSSVWLRDGAIHVLRAVMAESSAQALEPVLAALEDGDFYAIAPQAAQQALNALP
jgi:HEAT repeat protein